MVFADGALGLVMLGLWIFCIIDVITTPDDAVRNLPKLVWVMLVILLVDVGSIAWLIGGRSWNRGLGGADSTLRGERPSRRSSVRAMNPDDDEEFLAGLRASTEEQRRRARETQTDDPQAG